MLGVDILFSHECIFHTMELKAGYSSIRYYLLLNLHGITKSYLKYHTVWPSHILATGNAATLYPRL